LNEENNRLTAGEAGILLKELCSFFGDGETVCISYFFEKGVPFMQYLERYDPKTRTVPHCYGKAEGFQNGCFWIQ